MLKFSWGNIHILDKTLSIIFVLAVVGSLAASVYFIFAPKANDAFTSFYILDSEGETDNYPQEISLGEQVEMTIVIENFENTPVNYDVLVTIDGKEIAEMGSIELTHGEKWSEEIILIPSEAGDNQRVEFILDKDDEVESYLRLHFWLDVKWLSEIST